jgi:uncharacterized glyoxalase superfamily protein PhnB
MPTIFPALRYDDAVAAIDWLIRAFGFQKHAVYENPNGTIAHAELRLGDGIVMLGSARDDVLYLKTPRQLGGVCTATIYVTVDDPDAHYVRAKAAGAEIVYELKDQDYGSREYSARDLEGNIWSFGTYRPANP